MTGKKNLEDLLPLVLFRLDAVSALLALEQLLLSGVKPLDVAFALDDVAKSLRFQVCSNFCLRLEDTSTTRTVGLLSVGPVQMLSTYTCRISQESPVGINKSTNPGGEQRLTSIDVSLETLPLDSPFFGYISTGRI